MKRIVACGLMVLTFTATLVAQEQTWTIDAIVIDGTWITRDIVIESALDFGVGDTVTAEDLEYAEQDLYDLGLFSTVEFSWVTEDDGSTTLNILASDQLLIMPLLAVDGSSNTITLGASDGNFLGLNVDVRLAYEQEQEFATDDFVARRLGGSVNLPSSMLNGFAFGQSVDIGITGNEEHNYTTSLALPQEWLNGWRWSFNFTKSLSVSYVVDDGGNKLSGYSDNVWQVGSSVEPDWRYRIQPSLRVGWRSSEIGSRGVMNTGFAGVPGTTSFFTWGTRLAYGDIRTRNSYFQKNGWQVSADYDMGIRTAGDPVSSDSLYNKVALGGEVHFLAFTWLELASFLNYGYTDSTMPANQYDIRLHRSRDRAVPGLQVQGSSYYTLQNQVHLTYINMEWFALEHVIWFDIAQDNEADSLMAQTPGMAVGTGVRLRIPKIPWLYLYIDAQWALPATGQDVWGIKI